MKLFRALALTILGGMLLYWAASRAAAELLPSFQPTATSEQEVVRNFVPPAGALNRQASSGEVESQPITATFTAVPSSTATPQPVTAAPRPTLPGEISQQDQDRFTGSYLAERVVVVVVTSTPTPKAPPAIPDRIVISAINLDAPVTQASAQTVRVSGDEYYQWDSPNLYAAGWHTSSAPLGQPGNTVLNGHNNIYGAVFANLQDLSEGDQIKVYSGEQVFTYRVTQLLFLPEAGQPVAQRLENARWLSHTADERLTLVTCWPNDSNTYRLIVVAAPAG